MLDKFKYGFFVEKFLFAKAEFLLGFIF